MKVNTITCITLWHSTFCQNSDKEIAQNNCTRKIWKQSRGRFKNRKADEKALYLIFAVANKNNSWHSKFGKKWRSLFFGRIEDTKISFWDLHAGPFETRTHMLDLNLSHLPFRLNVFLKMHNLKLCTSHCQSTLLMDTSIHSMRKFNLARWKVSFFIDSISEVWQFYNSSIY